MAGPRSCCAPASALCGREGGALFSLTEGRGREQKRGPRAGGGGASRQKYRKVISCRPPPSAPARPSQRETLRHHRRRAPAAPRRRPPSLRPSSTPTVPPGRPPDRPEAGDRPGREDGAPRARAPRRRRRAAARLLKRPAWQHVEIVGCRRINASRMVVVKDREAFERRRSRARWVSGVRGHGAERGRAGPARGARRCTGRVG